MDDTPTDLGRLALRPASNPPEGERFTVEDYPNVAKRLETLKIVERPSVAILPRNFESAPEASALVRESLASGSTNVWAAVSSHYGPNTVYDPNYTYLPRINVDNTDLGYSLYFNGAIGKYCP